MRLALLGAILAGCSGAAAPEIILATTTSVQDSGLLDELLPAFTRDTGVRVKSVAVGSGEAIAMARRGAADAILTHSPRDEEALVREGVALDRTTVMTNTFLVVGPPEDPAGVTSAATAKEAFERIRGRHRFVSRGDKSGTHRRERDLWSANPEGSGYIESGAGMGETLLLADQKGAYTLSDIATYLAFRERLRLVILYEGGDDLLNRYTVMRVRGGSEQAARWIAWMAREAQPLIREFGRARYGRPLFLTAAE
jgi:tungstate transport system substrate-binding protein